MAKGMEVQSIIVPKKKAKTLGRAEAIAHHFSKSLPTHRETSTSFRFRQEPPSDFQPGSFRTVKKGGVSLVVGKPKK